MKKLSLLVLILTIIGCSKPETAIIKGSIKNVEAEKIILVKIDQDARFDSIIEIPVIENKFSFETKLETLEGYKLFLNESQGSYVLVFPENGITNIEIFGKNLSLDSKISGEELTNESNKLINEVRNPFEKKQEYISSQMDSLYEQKNLYSLEFYGILEELQETDDYSVKNELYKQMQVLRENNREYSVEGYKLHDANKKLNDEYLEALYDYIDTNNTLVSYHYLLRDLKFYPEKFKNIYFQERLNKYAGLYPNHKYTTLSKNWLDALISIQKGKDYVDFTAQDLNGNDIKFSDLKTNKYTLLDLWATWCGPCIAKSKSMLPVYEKYKDLNFEIIGVAGEYNSNDRLFSFIKKNQWPWPQLVDLDHKNKVWEKYGIDGSGGAIFLIDPQGKIAAINPEPEDVVKILEQKKI